ncbi:hypothetical protein CTAM01_16536 [Colletotrichum tamarilloi]|uniref:Peptidase S8/S53 domain-containing protein n=1 Tax=Colletotrichum tamarilloi TaxID=1209934 RepID=A0ABQ9QIF4_9PEZI|nr:uncharacterized protein CTAM01_16536 [Colletotrichum tamarilloi]KAK1471413.1 hypothetical protein CTAM01_16536 [Colletotrichum tamarilloi]
MANLICAIDPLCEIYVARVAEDAFGIRPDRVAKAIEWARSNDVDIISMSFVLGESSKELFDEINAATNQGIVMTCSTHDEGSRVEKAWPASYEGESVSLIVLAACDHYGRVLRHVEKDKYHYLIRGQNVAAGAIPFLTSEDTITGSSVSTALAAGISSLVLTCDRLAHPGKSYKGGVDEGSRYFIVKKHLNMMRSSEKTQFVVLEKFGGIDSPRIAPSDGPGIPSVQSVLEDKFEMRQQR